MGIKSDVEAVLAEFDKANEKLKGKAYVTGSDRTWEKQLDIILERPKSYPGIVKRFKDKFKDLKDKLPTKASELDKDQLAWWKAEIMKQAGKSPGFPHIGGKAVDVSVKSVDVSGKKLLDAALKKAKIGVLYENGSDYHATLAEAKLFHCY